jgi:hypothetical protein
MFKEKINKPKGIKQVMFDYKTIQKILEVLYNYRIRSDSLGKSSSGKTCYELQTVVTNYISISKNTL